MTQEQLYSTASYQTRNLSGIGFAYSDLQGLDFAEQDLTDSHFGQTELSGADFSGARRDPLICGVSS